MVIAAQITLANIHTLSTLFVKISMNKRIFCLFYRRRRTVKFGVYLKRKEKSLKSKPYHVRHLIHYCRMLYTARASGAGLRWQEKPSHVIPGTVASVGRLCFAMFRNSITFHGSYRTWPF